MVKKKILGIVFAVLLLCLSSEVPVYAEEMMDIVSEEYPIEQIYQFPLTSKDEEWKNLKTTDEMVAAYQIPEKILKRMNTKALVQTVLSDTFLTQFAAYNSSLDAMRIHEEIFNIYPEMESRSDYYEVLAELYDEAHVITTAEYNSRDVESNEFRYITNLEFLMAAEMYNNEQNMQVSLQKSYLEASVKEKCEQINAVREKEDIYSIVSNGFYWFYTMLPEDAEKKQLNASLYGNVMALNDVTTSTRTPNGTYVEVVICDELTAKQIADYDADYAERYPAATKLCSATKHFNCHSYAWYSQNVNTNTYWIRNPAAYWEDGSYTSTGITLNCKVRYLSGLHSAIVSYYSNGVTYYTSKWGSHGLYYHAPTYGPPFGAMQGVVYYIR